MISALWGNKTCLVCENLPTEPLLWFKWVNLKSKWFRSSRLGPAPLPRELVGGGAMRRGFLLPTAKKDGQQSANRRHGTQDPAQPSAGDTVEAPAGQVPPPAAVAAGPVQVNLMSFLRGPAMAESGPPRWGPPELDSSVNLMSFLEWANQQEPQEVLAALQTVFIIDHEATIPAWLPGPPQHIQPRARVGDHYIELDSVVCQDARTDPGYERLGLPQHCARCSEGRGGYMFRWIYPCWTPSLAFASPGETAWEVRQRCGQNFFPLGARRHPIDAT